MGDHDDLAFGNKIVEAMRPFVQHLIESGISSKTLKRHLDNLWLLGGEIIHDVHYHNDYETGDLIERIKDAVALEGISYHGSLYTESDLRSFKTTCRKYHKYFLKQA